VRRRWLLAPAGLILAAIVVLIALLTASSPTRRPPRPFAANSVWNQPLSPDAPLAPDSASTVAALDSEVAKGGAWMNTTSYSVPVYTVPRTQPRVPVTLDVYPAGDAAPLSRDLAAGVPIPPRARPAQGTDAEIVIWQPSTDTMWELWVARRLAGRWHARWGGVMDHASQNPGYFTGPRTWGASATSLPLLGGLIRISELRHGQINHALAIAIPGARAGAYVFPAERSDGALHNSAAVPEGTRFRLPANLNLAALHLPRLVQRIARAAQRYGMIVRDQSGGAVVFFGEDPSPTGSDPYAGPHGFFEGQSPAALLATFPWRRLQVVAPQPPAAGSS
jgi:hypothetical protein